MADGWIGGIDAAARHLGISHKPELIRALVNRGEIAGYVPYEGARPRFSKDELDAWMRSRPRYRCADQGKLVGTVVRG